MNQKQIITELARCEQTLDLVLFEDRRRVEDGVVGAGLAGAGVMGGAYLYGKKLRGTKAVLDAEDISKNLGTGVYGAAEKVGAGVKATVKTGGDLWESFKKLIGKGASVAAKV